MTDKIGCPKLKQDVWKTARHPDTQTPIWLILCAGFKWKYIKLKLEDSSLHSLGFGRTVCPAMILPCASRRHCPGNSSICDGLQPLSWQPPAAVPSIPPFSGWWPFVIFAGVSAVVFILTLLGCLWDANIIARVLSVIWKGIKRTHSALILNLNKERQRQNQTKGVQKQTLFQNSHLQDCQVTNTLILLKMFRTYWSKRWVVTTSSFQN